MIVAFVELLAEEQVVNKPRKELFPHVLAEKIYGLPAKISTLIDCLEKRNAYIDELEKRLTTMETNYNRFEQYSRHSNLTFHGIEDSENDDTTA